MEEEDLQAGNNMTPRIQDAIRTASVPIAIFFRAESSWCLDELKLIVESRSTIFPVFYNVKSAELRWGRKDECMLKPYTQLRRRRLWTLKFMKRSCDNGWREALSGVAEISDFELETRKGWEHNLPLNTVYIYIVSQFFLSLVFVFIFIFRTKEKNLLFWKWIIKKVYTKVVYLMANKSHFWNCFLLLNIHGFQYLLWMNSYQGTCCCRVCMNS